MRVHATSHARPTTTAAIPAKMREETIVRAEVDRLVHTLETFGPLRRETLARLSGARHWHRAELDRALRAGAREGRIRRRLGDFVEASYGVPDEAASEPGPSGAPRDQDAALPQERPRSRNQRRRPGHVIASSTQVITKTP